MFKTTIDPTEEIRKMAQDAVNVQTACNATAVVHSLAKHMSTLIRSGVGTDVVNQHPVVIAFLDKLASLSRVQGDEGHNRIMKAHGAVDDLAKGKEVEWETI